MAGLSGRRRPPRPSCLIKYNNILLPTNAVKFHIIIVNLCLLCRPHDGSVLNALLGKWVRRHPIASTSRKSLDAWINAWGSVSDLHACVGFRCSKKVEKHWSIVSEILGVYIWRSIQFARVKKNRKHCSVSAWWWHDIRSFALLSSSSSSSNFQLGLKMRASGCRLSLEKNLRP